MIQNRNLRQSLLLLNVEMILQGKCSLSSTLSESLRITTVVEMDVMELIENENVHMTTMKGVCQENNVSSAVLLVRVPAANGRWETTTTSTTNLVLCDEDGRLFVRQEEDWEEEILCMKNEETVTSDASEKSNHRRSVFRWPVGDVTTSQWYGVVDEEKNIVVKRCQEC